MDFRRKNLRKRSFDYSSPRAYFITICTQNKQRLFWKNGIVYTPGDEFRDALNETGQLVYDVIIDNCNHYKDTEIDCFVIMPNHVHLIVNFISDGLTANAPDLSVFIRGLKNAVTRKLGISVWQRSYYDHIIRDQKELDAIREYIYHNPMGMASEFVPFNDGDE